MKYHKIINIKVIFNELLPLCNGLKNIPTF